MIGEVLIFIVAVGFLLWAGGTWLKVLFQGLVFVVKKQPKTVFEVEVTDVGAGVSILLHEYSLRRIVFFIKYYREVSAGKYFGYTPPKLIQFLIDNSISSINCLYSKHSLVCSDDCNKLDPTVHWILAEFKRNNIVINH